MANYDQLNQELETLKSKFMLLDTDEERKAFRSEVTAFIDSKSDEEKQLVKLLTNFSKNSFYLLPEPLS